MIGFIVSATAVLLAMWITHAATYRAAYLEGQLAALARVPAGTESPCYPGDCDNSCPHSVFQQRRDSVARDIADATGATLDALAKIPERPNGMTDAELLAHVMRDDRIYGRNG